MTALPPWFHSAGSHHTKVVGEVPFFEDIVADGFEIFDRAQFFPDNIALVAGKESQHIYALSHATIRRKGRMTAAQKGKRAELEGRCRAPRRGIESSFTEALVSVSMIEREKSRVFGARAFLSREVLPLWS